jgi:hypothetical protein
MTTSVSPATVPRDGTADRLQVPWRTVLPLAVVAAFGSGFWIIAIRGAAGSIERASGPFQVWLQESTLLLPLYVFAVLAALTLALRWFGRGRLRARATAGTFLLVVMGVSLVATAVLAVNAVYDYQQQIAHLALMNATHGPCNAACLAQQKQDTVVVQTRAVGLGGLLVLVSNLVLLGLVVAFRGGRLDLASVHRRPERVSRFDGVEVFLMSGLLGAAAIHAVVIREQLSLWPAAGVFLVLLAIAEVDVAALFLIRLRSPALLATVVVSAGPLLLWLYSRTIGLPFGPQAGVPQPVGLADVSAALLEAAMLVVAVLALWSPQRQRTPSTSPLLVRLALVAVLAVTITGLGSGLGIVAPAGQTSNHTGHQQAEAVSPASART